MVIFNSKLLNYQRVPSNTVVLFRVLVPEYMDVNQAWAWSCPNLRSLKLSIPSPDDKFQIPDHQTTVSGVLLKITLCMVFLTVCY
jgi:hypothetical protein